MWGTDPHSFSCLKIEAVHNFSVVQNHIYLMCSRALQTLNPRADNSCLFLLLILFSAVSMFLFQMLHPWGSGQSPRKATGLLPPTAVGVWLLCLPRFTAKFLVWGRVKKIVKKSVNRAPHIIFSKERPIRALLAAHLIYVENEHSVPFGTAPKEHQAHLVGAPSAPI